MAKTLAKVALRDFGSTPVGTSDTATPSAAAGVDPRFARVNEALQAGDGNPAMEAAKELLAVLQKEKPPKPGLVNQARMSLTAAALLSGDLDAAQKSLLAVNTKSMTQFEKEQYSELRELLKAARQEAYSSAFQEAPDEGNGAKAKPAADQAGKLVELLQKTDPTNTAEISEARMRQANAFLIAANYKDAEKALKGIDEKSLSDEQREYLGAIRQGIQAQFIDALSRAYDHDMKRKNFKDAAINATVMVNNLAKHFPESKQHLVVARLQQVAAEIMNGDMEGARKTLGRIDRGHLEELPEGAGKRYKELTKAVSQHFENLKKEQAHKADVAAIAGQMKTIDELISSGKKADGVKAVPLAEQLVATIQQKFPSYEAAIAGAQLTVVNAKLAAGDIAGARADLQAISEKAKDPIIKDRVQLLEARAALKENQIEKGVQILRNVSTSAATPEVRKAAKEIIITLESGMLRNVESKTRFEYSRLQDIRADKYPETGASLLNPFTSVKLITGDYQELSKKHKQILRDLSLVGRGADDAIRAMEDNNLTLAEIQSMNFDQIRRLKHLDRSGRTNYPDSYVGAESAKAIVAALQNRDVKQIAQGRFQDKFSWQNNTWYVDASYLDTEIDKAAQWIGDKFRKARSIDEELKASDSLFDRAVGYTSGAILDAVSASNRFVKEKIKNASDFYNDPERKDTWYAALGRAGTFGADMLTMPFTMPATIADYKATDGERSHAITGTLIMAGTMGLIRAGGPAFRSLATDVSAAGSRVAASRVGQWVATSEFGQVVGSAAQKIGSKAAQIETRFEATAFARGMDKMGDTLGKANRFGRPKVSTGVEKEGAAAADADKAAKSRSVDPDAADTVKMRKVEAGQTAKVERGAAMDAADTVKMPKVQGGAAATGATTPAGYRVYYAGAGGGGATPAGVTRTAGGAGSGGARTTSATGAGPLEISVVEEGKSLQQVVHEFAGGKTAAQLRASITKEEIRAVENGLIAEEYKALIAAKQKDLARYSLTDKEAKAIIQNEYPGASLRETLRNNVRSKYSEDEIRQMALGERIYNQGYHGVIERKPATISQVEFERRLAVSKGEEIMPKVAWESPDRKMLIFEDDYWHIRRSNLPGQAAIESGGEIRRFYLNIKPDSAAQVAKDLSAELNRNGVNWQFKMPKELNSFDRPDSGVLYVGKAEYQKVKKIVMNYAEKHPQIFADGVPAFTKQIRSGIGVAEEPLQQNLPKIKKGLHSFGSSRSYITSEAIFSAPAGATRQEIMALVRERMRARGLDPDRPWLSKSTNIDDL
jgi:hypothetical protein